jgi:hypothetical protein
MRAFGHGVHRKIRAQYAYTPPWPFYNLTTGTETTFEMAMSLGLELLALGRLDKNRTDATSAHRRYWTPVNQLLAIGVLRTEIYEKLRQLIDADARHQDNRNRRRAGLPVPSILTVDYL